MSAPARDTPVTTSASGFADGFGRRLLAFAREDGAPVERLYLRPQFSVYEGALRDTFSRLARYKGGRVIGPHTIERDAASVVATSAFVSGERLGDLLESAAERARDGESVSGIDVAIGFLYDVLPALADLRSATGLPHGAVASSRCVFTPDGSVVITECGFATVLNRMNLSRERLWKEFGLAVPPFAGAARFDEACDIAQTALLALMLMVGRPLEAGDPIDVLPEWLAEAVEIAQIRGSVTFSVNLQRFLQRALPLAGRRPYQTIESALHDIRPMANAIGVEACRAALTAFVRAASGTVAADVAWPVEQRVQAPLSEPLAPPAGIPVASEPGPVEPMPLETAPAPPPPIASSEIDVPAPEPITLELDDRDEAPIEAPEPPLPVEAPAVEREVKPPVAAARTIPAAVATTPAPEVEPEAELPVAEATTIPAPAATTTAFAEAVITEPLAIAAEEPKAVEAPMPEPPPAPAPMPAPEPARRKRWRSRRTDTLRSVLTPPPQPKPEPGPAPIQRQAPAPVPEPPPAPPTPAPFIERPAAALVPLAPPPDRLPMPAPVLPVPAAPYSAAPGLVIQPMAAAPEVPQPVFTPLAAPLPDALWVPPVATTPSAVTAQPDRIVPKPQPITVASLSSGAPLKLRTEPPSSFIPRTPRFEPPREPARDPYPAYVERQPSPPPSGGSLGRALKVAAAAAIVIGAIAIAGQFWAPHAPNVIAEAPRTAPVTVAAPPPVTTGTLIVQTQPAGARVLLDGSAVGETPLRIVDVAAGRHVVTLITPTATVRRTVKVEANKELSLDVPVYSGWVAIFAPIVLEVSADGRALGTTDQGRLLLPPGRHTLTVINRDFGYSADHAVEIEAGEVRTLNLQPTGTVNLNALPWAEVWIDGKKAGETPLANLQLPLGNREIVFKHPEFGERKMMTRVTAGEPVAVSVDFSR